MISIIIYSSETGDILRCVACPKDMSDIQCGAKEAWIEHDLVDDTAFKVDLDTLQVVAI